MRPNRPNRRIPRSRVIAIHRPGPYAWPGAEWTTAAVAVALLALALLLP
jgi:hypothetical protein